MSRLSPFFAPLALAVSMAGCAGPAPYTYRFIPGKTAILVKGKAVAPPLAPPQVYAAIAAGNRIAGLPYRRGGGHQHSVDTAYDCSGAASFVLQAAGIVRGSMTSNEFRQFGQAGEGNWISIYARRDHVFLVVAGLRYDTGWTRWPEGPQWTTASRPTDNCVVRHPAGL